jgi:hypothetical protein
MDFSEVLSRAWQIIWKHKVLWIFGIFASCSSGYYGGGTGNGGGGNFSGDNFTSPSGSENFRGLNDFFRQTFGNLKQGEIIFWVIVAVLILILLILVISIVSIFLGNVGRIGLIRGVVQAEDAVKNNTIASISFGELFRSSLSYFWRVFFLNLLVYLGWTVFTFGSIIILILSIIGICILIPYCCLLIPMGWLVALYVEQCNIALVAENLSLSKALSRGWEVTRANLGSLILMGLILILGGGFVSFVLALPFILGITFIVLNIIAEQGNNPMTWIIISAVCCAAYIPVLIILVGILRAYIQSAWTLTYLRITTPSTPVSPILPSLVESQEAG